MKFISHRGNLNKKNIEDENKPTIILNAIKLGYDVEIDVRLKDQFLLGHDKGQYCVNLNFLETIKRNLWIHCKDVSSFEFFSKYNEQNNNKDKFNFFCHTNEYFIYTSLHNLWIYPGIAILNNSIIVLPEQQEIENIYDNNIYGICSDNIEKYRNEYFENIYDKLIFGGC